MLDVSGMIIKTLRLQDKLFHCKTSCYRPGELFKPLHLPSYHFSRFQRIQRLSLTQSPFTFLYESSSILSWIAHKNLIKSYTYVTCLISYKNHVSWSDLPMTCILRYVSLGLGSCKNQTSRRG